MKKTVDEIMQLSHCYDRKQVEKLFAGRKYLTLDDIDYLPIPHSDINDERTIEIICSEVRLESYTLMGRPRSCC